MPIAKIGSLTAQNCKAGSSQVVRLLLGNTQIWTQPVDTRLRMWLDASLLYKLLLSGGKVSQISDMSNNASNAALNLFDQPFYDSDGYNGLPTMEFTGDDSLTIANAPSIGQSTTADVTIFIVCKMAVNDANPKNLLSCRTGALSTGADYLIFAQSSVLYFLTGNNTNVGGANMSIAFTRTDTVVLMFTLKATGATTGSKSIWLNGVQQVSNNYTAKAPASANGGLGGNRSGIGIAVQGWNGLISEVRFYNQALTDAEKANLNLELLRKWNVQFYSVILSAGQSNAMGLNTVDPVLDAAVDGVFQFTQADAITAAAPPLNYPDAQAGLPPAFDFAKRLKQEESDDVLIVPVAVGGTGFVTNYWNPGNSLYNTAVNQSNDAIAAVPGNNIKAILWSQGENDANNNRTKAQYKAALTAMIEGMRAAITRGSTVPFVIIQMVPEFAGGSRAQIDAAQREICSEIPYTWFTFGVSGQTSDNLHYNAAATRVNGQNAYDALINARQNYTNTPATPETPTGLHVASTTSNSITIGWDRDTEALAAKYRVDYKLETEPTTWTTAGTAYFDFSYTITGVTPLSNSYDIRVVPMLFNVEGTPAVI